jgi:hypothetical protein
VLFGERELPLLSTRSDRPAPARAGRRAFRGVWTLGVMMLCLPAARGDTLIVKPDTTHEGRFEAYRNERFYFAPGTGRGVAASRLSVVSLAIVPPAAVSVQPRGKRRVDDLKFAGYHDQTFFFERNGTAVPMAAATVQSVKTALDFEREMQLAAGPAVAADNADFDLDSAIERGVTTVVHFHMPSVMSSVRQGSLVQSLAGQSKGKVKVLTLQISSFDSPLARKYAIQSAPQFWFYDPQGRQTRKLVDRFTDEDIESALKAAR